MANLTILNRVRSLVAGSPFYLEEAVEPFNFDLVPATVINDAVRIECATTAVTAGLSWSEERTDTLTVWVAQMVAGVPHDTAQALHTLCNSITSAVVHDGAGAGDFAVLDDGRSATIEAAPQSSFYVGRLTLPVSYMMEV